jgi:hypothetical protein
VKSQYKSGKSVAKNPTVPISADDPRVAWNKINQTKSRQGAEVDIIGLDGKALIAGGTKPGNQSGSNVATNQNYAQDKYLPPINGMPESVYPGQGPFVILPTNPSDVTASWSGEDLIVQFNWDYENVLNQTVSQFILELTADGITKRTALNLFPANKTQTAQTITLTKALNIQTFGILRNTITSICVLVADPLNNISDTICAATVPTYVLDLPTPTITVTSINAGYSVAYTTPTQSSFNSIEIVEYESDSATEPTGVTYLRTYLGTISPANIIVHNFNKRWVKARFTSDGGLTTSYSTATAVTPTSPVSVDNVPPNEVASVSASWLNDDIVVTYTLPSSDAAVRIQIQLTAPNNLVGYFYRFPTGSGTNQTTTIYKKDLFDQFGEHYSSFTGLLKSIDINDNKTSGVSFNVAARSNPLSGVTPTFTTVPLSNAYSVNFTLPTGATFAEIYAKHTAWSGNPTDDTYVVYAGLSPGIITDTDYTTVYIKIRYYDDFNNTSGYSEQGTTTPLDPAQTTSFESPITFGANGVIYAGNSATSGTRTIFKSSGIFAYDATNTSPSTQIVSNASAGTPTFITKQAQIADWKISEYKIENDLSGTPTKYTGLSASGTYAFWAGSSTSGGNSSAKFTVTPLGAVTARELYIVGTGDANSNLISAGGLFTVKHDGTLTATGATLTGTLYATGGEFTGNVKLNGGSLYALGSGGSVNSGIRTVFNSSGIAAYNASGGYTAMLTTPLANGAIFTTNAADIGGWTVDTNRIYKTSISGKGNIEIDSTNGYIAVSHSSVSDSKAGINSPTNSLTDNVFWAGTYGPTSTSNPFRVTLGGALYATNATISGTVSSVGALGTMSLNGEHGYMSLATAGNNNVSYLVPRNGNIYLTAPSSTAPWSTGTEIASSGPTNAPYLSAGAGFKDRYNATVSGIGIYTGTYTGSGTKPFLSATTTGIQLKASENVAISLEPTTGTNPGIIITSGPNNAEGAITVNNGSVKLQASTLADQTDSPYDKASTIILSNTGVQIFGINAQGDADIAYRTGGYNKSTGLNTSRLSQFNSNPTTGSLYPLGPYGRQRMVVQSEYTGELLRGMAVYYGRTTDPIGNNAPSNAGYVGDLFVVY